MAKTNAQQAAAAPKSAKDFKLGASLPEGFSDDEFETIGSLRPICQPESMMDHPVGGELIALLDMPPRKDKSQWKAFLIHLLAPTMARAGEDLVEVSAGEKVLVPVSGSLKTNTELLGAACDPHRIWIVKIQCVGQIDVGKQSDMWSFDVKRSKKTLPRTGEYALSNFQPAGMLNPTANGEVQQLGKGDITDRNGHTVSSVV